MEQKKILLLGGSTQQVVAIKAAKELGYYTVLCDYLPDNPGQYIADKFYQVSTTDIEAVYNVAKTENVDGILPYASDPAALPAAIVCERLGLPTNPVKSVEILGLKHPWRNFLRKNGFACPKSKSFSPSITKDEFKKLIADFEFPVVVKPTDSSGSKGVSVLDNLLTFKEAVEWASQYSRNKILIVEEYIKRGFPNVIGGDIFVWDGKIVLWGEMLCLRDEVNSPLIPIGKIFPSGLSEVQTKKLHAELQKLINALDISFGEFNIEVIIDNNDNVHFLELGPRAGGNMIPVQLSDVYSIDLIKANIWAAMGEKPDFVGRHIVAKDVFFMHYVLHSYNDGKFKGLWIEEELKKNIYRTVLYKKYGDNLEKFDGAGKAVGIIFLQFDTLSQMDVFCENHNNLIKVLV